MNNFVIQPESTRPFAVRPDRAAPTPEPAKAPSLSHEDVARRAYDLYVKKGRQPGQCQQNWHQAEHDLRHGGGECGCGPSSAPRTGSAPIVKNVAGGAPSNKGGRRSNA